MAGYQGFLFRINSGLGNFDVTGSRIIAEGSYKASVKIQDMGAFRDANGVLHRNTLDNVPIKVVVTTLESKSNTQLQDFWQNIRSRMTISKERKINATFWVPEYNDYVTQDLYVVDPEFVIDKIKDNEIYYKAMDFSFIGY